MTTVGLTVLLAIITATAVQSGPSVEVQVSPTSVRILDTPPYNRIVLISNATALQDGERMPLAIRVEWSRRSKPPVGIEHVTGIVSSRYEVFGSPEEGYRSQLNVTESDTVNAISYRCTVRLASDRSGTTRDHVDVPVEVIGPTNPIPAQVTTVDIRDVQVTIHWVVSSIAYTPERYAVEYGTLAEQDSMDLRSTVQESGQNISITNSVYSVTLSGLNSSTTYYYRIVSNNTHGSVTSDLKVVTTSSSIPPSTAPKDFRHRVVSGVQGSIHFSWSPPVHTLSSVILFYSVTCTPTEGSRRVYNTSSYLNVTLSSLAPNTYYTCTISASTAGGEGPQSDPISVSTVPEAPHNLVLVAETSGNHVGVLATWSRVAGAINYTVIVTNADRPEKEPTYMTSVNSSHLIPSEKIGGYERILVEVVAVNSAGFGPPSDPEQIRTPATAPGVVSNPQFSQWGNNTVRASWEQPDYPNGVISGYNITVGYYGSDLDQDMIIGVGVLDNETFSADIQHTLLVPGAPFIGSITAINQVGEGEGELLLFYSRDLPARALKLFNNPIRSSSGTMLTLSWQALSPGESRGTVIAFQINLSEMADDDPTSAPEHVGQDSCSEIGESCTLRDGRPLCCLVQGNQSSASITGLHPHRAYRVTIAAVNGAGLGEPSAPVTVPATETKDSSDGIGQEVVYVAGGGAVIVVILMLMICIGIGIVLSKKKHRRRYKKQLQSKKACAKVDNMYGGLPCGCSLWADGEDKPYDDVVSINRDWTIPTHTCSAYVVGKDAGPSAGLNPDTRASFGSDEHIYAVAT